LKILNDAENPQENQDRSILIPSVTQSLNRQVIQSLGISRESLHFNIPANFYPLADVSVQDKESLNETFDILSQNVYEQGKHIKHKNIKYIKKFKVPQFFENQIVFAIDQAPRQPGVSSILKLPTRGPYRILKLDQRNVTLSDIETVQNFQSHVELFGPLNIKEFRLLLNKHWDLNNQCIKSAYKIKTRSAFETPQNPLSTEEAKQAEETLLQEADLEKFFQELPVDKRKFVSDVMLQGNTQEIPPDIEFIGVYFDLSTVQESS